MERRQTEVSMLQIKVTELIQEAKQLYATNAKLMEELQQKEKIVAIYEAK